MNANAVRWCSLVALLVETLLERLGRAARRLAALLGYKKQTKSNLINENKQ